jgi:sulfotransferase
MLAKVHLISGLPRSGSTLLSALLRQNPRFYAAMTSPVSILFGALQPKMSGGEFSGFFDDATRAGVLRAVFESYYAKKLDTFPAHPVVFDTNRSWPSKAALLAELYPESRAVPRRRARQ